MVLVPVIVTTDLCIISILYVSDLLPWVALFQPHTHQEVFLKAQVSRGELFSTCMSHFPALYLGLLFFRITEGKTVALSKCLLMMKKLQPSSAGSPLLRRALSPDRLHPRSAEGKKVQLLT